MGVDTLKWLLCSLPSLGPHVEIRALPPSKLQDKCQLGMDVVAVSKAVPEEMSRNVNFWYTRTGKLTFDRV